MSSPSRDDWRTALTLLDTALELEPSERAAWLRSLTPGEARLSPLLEELLHSHAEGSADAFLQKPAIDALELGTPPGAPGTGPEPTETQTVVGPYRLLRQIGAGGMASVWLADRSDGLLDRRVALKLPHQTWGVASFADRMSRERNILAALTHPSIARLYDAGIAADGRPYLALEYVDGVPIDAYATAQALNVRTRVALVVEVARAVAHAHARLVVHRDLKPSNILVDAEGHAHLLDFGIARMLDSSLADAAQQTQAWGRALTPDYASPEQIRGDEIGTASDVYSLGVVLFELLAGGRPYRLKKGLGAASLAQAITDVDPPRPSAVALDPAAARLLRGDLDAIVARAMAKAPDARYATIDAFADDLERHLRGEPVQARPDSRWYRAERWIRRHKLESSIVVAALVAALGGAYAQVLVVGALAMGATVALWQRNRALEEMRRAKAALDRAEQVKSFVASIFTQAVPRAGQGGPVTALGLLQAASQRVEIDLAAQPEVAAELGALIGASLNELGEVQAGLQWLPRAVDLCIRALGPMHHLTLQTRWRLVEAANTCGELLLSEPMLPALVCDTRAAQPPEPALLVAALRSSAFVHTKRGRETEAMSALNEALDVANASLGESSDVALTTRSALSNTYRHFGHDVEALRSIEPALELARRAFGASRPHPLLLWIERAHADALARNRRPRDAAAILRQALRDQRLLDAGDTQRVGLVMANLAYALLEGGHFAECDGLLRDATAMSEGVSGTTSDEAVGRAVGRGLAAALGGDGAAALAHVAQADTWMSGRSEAPLLTLRRDTARMLGELAAGHVVQALAEAERVLAGGQTMHATLRVRVLRVRTAALRLMGEADAASEAAALGAAAAADRRCAGLEVGLMWAEAARCSVMAQDLSMARQQFDQALAAWKDGQVDGEALTAVHSELASLRRAA